MKKLIVYVLSLFLIFVTLGIVFAQYNYSNNSNNFNDTNNSINKMNISNKSNYSSYSKYYRDFYNEREKNQTKVSRIIELFRIYSVNPVKNPVLSENLYFSSARLNGTNEVPPVDTNARGRGVFLIDTDNNRLYFQVRFTNLQGNFTEAHIHGPALPSKNADVLFPLPDPYRITNNLRNGVIIGKWNYSEEIEEEILDGPTYVNIHSAVYPNGELRAQILPEEVVIGRSSVPFIFSRHFVFSRDRYNEEYFKESFEDKNYTNDYDSWNNRNKNQSNRTNNSVNNLTIENFSSNFTNNFSNNYSSVNNTNST